MPATGGSATAGTVGRALGTRVRRTTWLAGGHRTGNWRLDLADGTSVVARRYAADRSVCAVEAAVLRRLAGQVPVPEVVLADPDGRLDGVPLLVTAHVDGVPAATVVREGDDAGVRTLAEDAGRTLAAIAAVRFPGTGFFDPATPGGELVPRPMPAGAGVLPWIRAQLDRARDVPADLRERWWALLVAAEPALPAVAGGVLTHADYNPKNLLASRDPAGRWRVAAVLDWEFAHAGHPLTDVGNWLRFAAERPPGYAEGFLTGYRDAGGDLPGGFELGARLLDAMALADFLAAGPEAAYHPAANAVGPGGGRAR